MRAIQSILVIDDEADVGEFVCAAAQAMGFDCAATTDATTFLEVLSPETTLILLDLVMPELDGVELLRQLGEQKCKAGIILMSGSAKRIIEAAGQLAHALGLTIVGHLQKPFRLAELEKVLAKHADAEAPAIARQDVRVIIRKEELRQAIARDEFVLHYQPQIDIATGHLIGVEALVRWEHPESRGMSEVGQFTNGTGKPPMLSLNESVYSLHDLKFPDILVSLAEKHGIAPSNITIEITESGLIKELSNTLDILTRLRMRQVKLSIDDFGTGYAMMQQLKVIPATELKIDRTFILDMHNNERDRVIVQKTIEMGHELGMHVIAEGVETQEQLDFLNLKGCDSAQGYLFSRPLPVGEMVTWLKTYRAQFVH